MNIQQALSYIDGTRWFGSRPGLERTEELLDKLGRPQDGLIIGIHFLGLVRRRRQGDAAVADDRGRDPLMQHCVPILGPVQGHDVTMPMDIDKARRQ